MTHLIVIRVREIRAHHALHTTSSLDVHTKHTLNPGVFPPTSTPPNSLVTVGLVTLYMAAFGVSLYALITEDLHTSILTVVHYDAEFEVLCACTLGLLLYVGIKERKRYLEITREIRLEDVKGATAAGFMD